MEKESFNQIDYINRYNKEKYDRITILIPKGGKEIVKSAAKKNGQSMNNYIVEALKDRIPELEEGLKGKLGIS